MTGPHIRVRRPHRSAASRLGLQWRPTRYAARRHRRWLIKIRAGMFAGAAGLAWDELGGGLYVVDLSNHRVQEFT